MALIATIDHGRSTGDDLAALEGPERPDIALVSERTSGAEDHEVQVERCRPVRCAVGIDPIVEQDELP